MRAITGPAPHGTGAERRRYFVCQRARVSPRFLLQTSLVPFDAVAVLPVAEQNWPALAAPPGAEFCAYQRGRASPGFLAQRAQEPVVVLPTEPAMPQNRPTFTAPRTVVEACGTGLRVAAPDGRAVFAIVVACFLPPQPVSTVTALSATPVSTSGRFM
jgi:hypothetical protein